ncbi:Activator of Hsp90 ATPase homolog 1-like protein [Flavobacterium aquidurense]|uniref:Polyketide cyclase n=1 Tax=Flavobacterium frigidimaris TaxID=262320 RepID=A0ABX4BSE8_FLAFR|nr:SRPBCC domain-containing protein [Flavobacterium frigidimaris]OXA79656.1 polyketide cyclase [Flavobacterium frigidimaris]SDZ18297.1 Activator of Hsp90 ATPase homolog 1-like protein [Flavobacterium aquidurense]
MIAVQNTINTSIEKVWDLWTSPEHIMNWNVPFENWHTPYAENDLKVGGKFKFTMAAKDGSDGFDFEGIYTKIEKFLLIEYKLTDNRTANVRFESNGSEVKITETFEPETKISEELQEQFCRAVIQNFKSYAENLKRNSINK